MQGKESKVKLEANDNEGREKEKRVWIIKGKVQIEGKQWIWDKQMEALKDNKSRCRKKEEGREKRKKMDMG